MAKILILDVILCHCDQLARPKTARATTATVRPPPGNTRAPPPHTPWAGRKVFIYNSTLDIQTSMTQKDGTTQPRTPRHRLLLPTAIQHDTS